MEIQSYLKTRKKQNIWKYKESITKYPSKRSFRHRIHSSQRRADADTRGSADIIYRIWRISL